MKRRILIWLANRAADKSRRKALTIRRDLRDHVRTQADLARQHDIIARGLRLYAAWSGPRVPRPAPRGLSALIPGARCATAPMALVRKEAA